MADLRPILLAEDNSNDMELTLEALAECNLANEIVAVPDGAEALDFLFRRNRFEGRVGLDPVVVLLDLKMPKVDGLEVLRKVKSDEQMRPIPIVMLTSSREEQDIIESYRLGVNAYVVKPINFSQFIEAVKQLGIFWGIINEPPLAADKPT